MLSIAIGWLEQFLKVQFKLSVLAMSAQVTWNLIFLNQIWDPSICGPK